jgi:hypothetical protein
MGRALAKPIVVFHEVMGFARAQPILQSQASRSAEIGLARFGAAGEVARRAGRVPFHRSHEERDGFAAGGGEWGGNELTCSLSCFRRVTSET